MGKELKVLKILYSILSLITVILGFLMVIRHPETRNSIFIVSGIILVIYGIIKIISYFSRDLLQLAYKDDLAVGIIAMILGFLFLFWKHDYISTIERIFSVFLIFDSVLKIQTSIESKKIGLSCWIPIMVMSILGFLGGMCIFSQSFKTSTMAISFIGICLVMYGVMNLIVVINTALIEYNKGE